MTQASEVITESRGPIRILRIHRPEARNALSPEVIRLLGRGLEEAEQDAAVRAVIVTGTGDRAFCAGMDLRAFAQRGSPGSTEDTRGFQRFVRDSIDKPVVAAANGSALAGGFELLLACDLAVASSKARFGLPEAKRGLFAAGGGIHLGRRIPLALALELGLTGEAIDAQRALAVGLVNAVVPPARVLEEAIALAERVVANGPLGVLATKKLMRLSANVSREAAHAEMATLQPIVFGSEDAREGATAFIEKRAPQWKGR